MSARPGRERRGLETFERRRARERLGSEGVKQQERGKEKRGKGTGIWWRAPCLSGSVCECVTECVCAYVLGWQPANEE